MQPDWERVFWLLNVGARALVIWRLYSIGLNRKYRFFFAGILVGLLRVMVLLPFKPTDNGYMVAWAFTQPLVWLFRILVVSELYSLVLTHYLGIYCWIAWLTFLSKEGEDRITSLNLGRSTLQEQHLLRQLDDMNASLLRVARK